jgi:hypothetical protein
MPCYYHMDLRLQENGVLHLGDIATHWYLTSLPAPVMEPLVLETAIAVVRGRPIGAAEPVHHRPPPCNLNLSSPCSIYTL